MIGVAGSRFRTATHAVPVARGSSVRPLFVTAAGMPRAGAADLVRRMTGRYRLPDAPRRAGTLARAGPPRSTRTDASPTDLLGRAICGTHGPPLSRGHADLARWLRAPHRRQQVIPDPSPSSCGRSSRGMPVHGTNKMPRGPRGHPAACGPPRDDRQQRPDPGPWIVRDDPRPLLPLPHGRAQPSREHRYSHTPFC